MFGSKSLEESDEKTLAWAVERLRTGKGLSQRLRDILKNRGRLNVTGVDRVGHDKTADKTPTGGPTIGGYGGPVTYDYDPKQGGGGRPDKPGGFTDPGKGSYGPHKAEGGRIGYERGRVVNPGGYSGMSMFQAWLQDQYGIGMGDIKSWDHYAGLSREWNRLGGSKADGGIARLL